MILRQEFKNQENSIKVNIRTVSPYILVRLSIALLPTDGLSVGCEEHAMPKTHDLNHVTN